MKKLGLLVSTVVMSLSICTSAFAASINSISEVKTISISDQKAELGIITIQEESDFPTDFSDNDTFSVRLPLGFSFNQETKVEGPVRYWLPNERTMDLTMINMTDSVDMISITPVIDIQDEAVPGNLKALIDCRDSGVSSGEMVIAKIVP